MPSVVSQRQGWMQGYASADREPGLRIPRSVLIRADEVIQ
jgi:hypothetical protein